MNWLRRVIGGLKKHSGMDWEPSEKPVNTLGESIARHLLEDDEDDFDPKADALRLGTKPIGWALRLGPTIDVMGKPYPRRDRWLNARTMNFRQYLGDATIFKRFSTTKQWPHLEAVPVYANPRKYGNAALDPRSVLRENEENDDFDPKEVVRQTFQHYDFTAASGKKFRVKLEWAPGPYTIEGVPSVRFYDFDYASPEHPDGQRTPGGYHATTLLSDHRPGRGLCLYGSEPAWNIDGRSFAGVIEWLKQAWPQWEEGVRADKEIWNKFSP